MLVAKEDIKVSIILPIYNVGKYFSECMNSIFNQSHKNIEIILIDDGSTDDSGQQADVFAEQDKRVRVVHKTNGGVSSARNVGIKIATGDYICFSDPDDILKKDYVSYLLDLCLKNDVDISVCAEVFTPFMRIQPNANVKVVTGEEAATEILYGKITVGCYSKMFKTAFLKDNSIHFLEDVSIGEGFNFNVYAFCNAQNVAISQHKVYYYRLDNSGSAMTKFNIRKCEMGIEAIDRIRKELPYHTKKLDAAIDFAKYSTTASMIDWMVNAGVENQFINNYRYYCGYVRRIAPRVLLAPTSVKQRIATAIRIISPSLWSKIRKFARRVVLNAKNNKSNKEYGKITKPAGGGNRILYRLQSMRTDMCSWGNVNAA